VATLKDISEATGISVSTISRVLNQDETISVTPQTHQKILDTARSMGYVPIRNRAKPDLDRPSSILKMGIAQMFEHEQVLQDPYYLYMKHAIEQVCFSKGIQTTPLFRNHLGQFTVQGGDNLDGIFAIGSFTRQEILNFESLTRHIVFVDSSPDDEHYYSAVPNFHLGLRQALGHLLEAGHRKIAFLGSHYTLQEAHDLKLDARLYYFRNSLQAKSLYNPSYVLDCPMNSPAAYQTLSQALKSWEVLPTALFLSSDSLVQGALRALDEAHLSIPGQMSVIAFNDTPLSQNATPPLTSIRVLQHEMAVAAMASMELCRSGWEYPFKTVVPCVYIDRGSIAPPVE
jgi:LacI family transcriptional regulator